MGQRKLGSEVGGSIPRRDTAVVPHCSTLQSLDNLRVAAKIMIFVIVIWEKNPDRASGRSGGTSFHCEPCELEPFAFSVLLVCVEKNRTIEKFEAAGPWTAVLDQVWLCFAQLPGFCADFQSASCSPPHKSSLTVSACVCVCVCLRVCMYVLLHLTSCIINDIVICIVMSRENAEKQNVICTQKARKNLLAGAWSCEQFLSPWNGVGGRESKDSIIPGVLDKTNNKQSRSAPHLCNLNEFRLLCSGITCEIVWFSVIGARVIFTDQSPSLSLCSK